MIGLFARYLSCENGFWKKYEDILLSGINCRVEPRFGRPARWICDN
jgi:hypothetical protein